LGKAVESGQIPLLILLDAFHGDVGACTTVAVVLMGTVLALEPLLVPIRTLRISAAKAIESTKRFRQWLLIFQSRPDTQVDGTSPH
jgi:hypothetical protein